jgi:hypothetical protein
MTKWGQIANKAIEVWCDGDRAECPDLDSGKISSDVSVHLYEFKPAVNTYLAGGNAPVKSLEEIISSGNSIPTSGTTSTKHKALKRMTATACGYRSAPTCSSAS